MFKDLNITYNILIIMTDPEPLKNNKDEFYKIIREFVPDLLHTFPEHKENLDAGIIDVLQNNTDTDNVEALYQHCLSIYPERFFDILYQNEDIFTKAEYDRLYFLPNIDFKRLWDEDISTKTKEVIWKYLQLILFSVVSDVKHENSFGDTAKLFEAINEDELKQKLEKTLEEMHSLFENEDGTPIDSSNINLDNLPNPEDIHSHLNGMLGGKLGALAREIAEETAQELNVDMDEATNVNDVFQKLFKNPGKLMNLVKGIGNKIETKIKDGSIKESELMKEAGEMMSKMNNMPGMGNIKSMLKQFGLPLGKGTNVNMGAFQSHMSKNMRQSKMRERMQQRLAAKQNTVVQQMSKEQMKQMELIALQAQEQLLNEVERTPRVKKSKKKKRKKKKNKDKEATKEKEAIEE